MSRSPWLAVLWKLAHNETVSLAHATILLRVACRKMIIALCGWNGLAGGHAHDELVGHLPGDLALSMISKDRKRTAGGRESMGVDSSACFCRCLSVVITPRCSESDPQLSLDPSLVPLRPSTIPRRHPVPRTKSCLGRAFQVDHLSRRPLP